MRTGLRNRQRSESLRKIEVPSEELGRELIRHLEEGEFTGATYDRGRRIIQIPDGMDASKWSNLKDDVEEWAKGRQLEVVESLRLQPSRREGTQAKPKPQEQGIDVKKRLEKLTPQEAEERYNYLQSRPISELTDAEYQERLALAQGLTEKPKHPKR